MNDARVIFTRADEWSNWRTVYDGERASLCDSGVKHYVGIPNDCMTFVAVFTNRMPFTDYFNLTKPTGYIMAKLDTADPVSWLGRALRLMDKMYQLGYRYVRVEY